MNRNTLLLMKYILKNNAVVYIDNRLHPQLEVKQTITDNT
jgi:hypothetical protein